MTKAYPRLSAIRLPKSLFWRFFWTSVLVAVVTALVAMGISSWMARTLVRGLQEETGYTVLRNAVDIMGKARITDELMYSKTLQLAKDELSSRLHFVSGYLDSFNAQILDDSRSRESVQKEALTQLTSILEYDHQDLFVMDQNMRIAVPPATELLNQTLGQENDAMNAVVNKLSLEARNTASGQAAYTMFRNRLPATKEHNAILLAAMEYKPWGIVLYAGSSMDKLHLVLAQDRLTNLEELRARLAEIVLGKTGYLYFFDENCIIIGHPSLTGQDISTVKVPNLELGICDELKRAAEKPWGQNKYQYLWDHPSDAGNFVYPKISWVSRDPVTGWYIGTSAYIRELEESLPQLQLSIFLPALGSILLINLILALLLRNLLRPVKELTDQCQKVAKGDLSAQAEVDAPGEVGFLCRHFNHMVTSLRQSKQREQDKRSELEQLNKNLESIVDERTVDLKLQAKELESANLQLVELDELKSSFLSSVSHELRTPLTSILGFSKLINKEFCLNFLPLGNGEKKLERKGRRISENLEIIEHEGQRLTRMIGDFLDLAKIESGHMSWKDRDVDSHALLLQAANAVSGMFVPKPDVDLITEIPQHLPVLHVDPDRLEQVIINLLNNAAKFTEKGSVTLGVDPTPQGTLRIWVMDTGPGIPPNDIEKIFDKFHQVVQDDTRQKKSEGTGLGLAICQEIVEHYEGRIWVESVEGEGCKFIVELPVAEGQSPQFAPEQLSGSGPLILVVDDDPSICSYISQLLTNEGYRTLVALNGLSALELAQTHRPDCITTDILMPGMNGNEFISQLRATPSLAAIPILVITVLENYRHKSANFTLTKPVDDEKLLGALKALLTENKSDIPTIALRPKEGTESDLYVTVTSGGIEQCDEAELWARLEAGFQGTVILPAWTAAMDLPRLSSYEGVQVIILPAQPE